LQHVFGSLGKHWAARLILAAALFLLSAGSAGGHSDPVRSEPAAGSVVFLPLGEGGGAPGTFRLRTWLSERAERNFSFLEVHDPAGQRVDVAGTLAFESQGAVIAVDVAPKRIGEHKARYRLLSAVDGHINTGEYAFYVAEAHPGANSRLEALPGRLTFRTPKALGAQSIKITLLRDGASVYSGSAGFAAAEDADVAALDLPESAAGNYEVRWELMTNQGPRFGSYFFTVGGS